MASTRASGTMAVRYGTMRENVLGVKVVLADGRVITAGTRARKSSAGYDLTRLFVGAEGTLGVITEVTVRLHPIPEAVSAAVCAFASIEGAIATVISTVQLGIPVARIELLDEVQMDAVNRYSKTAYRVAPTLFFEFHSDSAGHVNDQARAVEGVAADNGGLGFEWATRLEDRETLWRARHDALYAAIALRPGARRPTSSRSRTRRMHRRDEGRQRRRALRSLVGHAGDGNFHLIYVIDPEQPAEIEEARRLNERLVLRALALGGTCTGEHGVGYGKMKFLEAEHGAELDVMRALKRTLDPDNRMNPGKMVDV